MVNKKSKLRLILILAFFSEIFLISELYLLLEYGFGDFVLLLTVLSLLMYIESMQDIFSKTIRIDLILFGLGFLIFYMFALSQMQNVMNLFWGGLVFFTLYGISLISHEAIGKGDAFMLGLIFAYMGAKIGFLILLLSLMLFTFFAIIKMFFKRVKPSHKIVMTPFFYLGFLFAICIFK